MNCIGTWYLEASGRGLRLVCKADLFRYVTKLCHEIGGDGMWMCKIFFIYALRSITKSAVMGYEFARFSSNMLLEIKEIGGDGMWSCKICFKYALKNIFKSQVSGIRTREPLAMIQVIPYIYSVSFVIHHEKKLIFFSYFNCINHLIDIKWQIIPIDTITHFFRHLKTQQYFYSYYPLQLVRIYLKF